MSAVRTPWYLGATVVWIARLVTGGVFIAASYHKILEPAEFALAIHRYRLLPDAGINLTAIFLPWLELLAGFALILAPGLRRGAILVLAGLLMVFTAAIGLNIARGINVACGCFSSNPEAAHTNWVAVARNTGLLLVAAVAWIDAFRPAAPAGATSPAPPSGG